MGVGTPGHGLIGIGVLLTALAFTACHSDMTLGAVAPGSVSTAEQDIARVLDDWHDAAAHADADRYFAHLAADAVFLGTDASERWTKEEFIAYATPHFARGRAWSFQATRRAIALHPNQSVAHFDEDLATAGLGPARGSGVLARRDGEWKLLQYNLALTVPNDRFDLTREAAGAARVLVSTPGALDAVVALVGSWVGTTADGIMVEEHWTAARGGMLLGMGRATADGATRSFEALRIEARPNGGIVYVAQPDGGTATEFTLASASTRDHVVFENRSHDYPKRLSYTRDEDGLLVEIAGGPETPTQSYRLSPALIGRTRH